MTEPNNNENLENTSAEAEDNVASAEDIAAAAAATEDFGYTIGDALNTESDDDVEDVAPVIHEGPIQTVGRRKRAIARIVLKAGSGEIKVNGRDLED